MDDLIKAVLQAVENAPHEADILGTIHPADIGQPWMNQDTYRIYWAIGRAFKPTSYLEIGVRFGYSIQAVATGSGRLKTAYGFDNEYDLAGSLDIARSRLASIVENLHLQKYDTQSLATLGNVPTDIAHIDGWHTRQGVYHDCQLAFPQVKANGLLLIDDVGGIDGAEVRRGADEFCTDHGLTPHYLPCFHGMYLIRKIS